jgi:hypothetical protein
MIYRMSPSRIAALAWISTCPVPSWTTFFVFTLLLAAVATAQENDSHPAISLGVPKKAFTIDSPQIDESSGLVPSVRYKDCFWTHNDNGNHPGLFLIDSGGKHLATVQIRGAGFTDWEAVTLVADGERTLLAIGDIGDNNARRKTCRIYLIDEPELDLKAGAGEPLPVTVTSVETITFHYPEGPQDCEALAYDPHGKRFWLVSKQRPFGPGAEIAGGKNGALTTTTFHSIDWPAANDRTGESISATRIESAFNALFVTGMDISADSRWAAVRTQWQVFLFERTERQDWRDAFAGEPVLSSLFPAQKQGESICFSADCTCLWLSSEGVGQPVWRIPLVVRPSR